MSYKRSRRDPAHVMQCAVLGSAWPSKFSFSEQFLRHAGTRLSRYEVVRWNLDDHGDGYAVFEVAFGGEAYWIVYHSKVLDPSAHAERIIASAWDFGCALMDRCPTPEEIEVQRGQIPQVATGRALPGTIAWSRGNRSVRLFDHVVEKLAAGEQPDIIAVDEVGYLIRTVSFAGNGRYGTREFPALSEHAGSLLGPSYLALIFLGYTWREFGALLVEHLARVESPHAATTLSDEVRRRIGLGNSSGLGLVPFLFKHPRLVHRWVAAREDALVDACERRLSDPGRNGDMRATLLELVARAARYLREWRRPDDGPFESPASIATQLDRLVVELAGFDADAFVGEVLDRVEREFSVEAQELVIALIHEADPSDPDTWAMTGDESLIVPDGLTVGDLRAAVRTQITHLANEPASRYYFWYMSDEALEPRRGIRGEDQGEQYETPIDILADLQRLDDVLGAYGNEFAVALVLVEHPEVQGTAGRAATVAEEPYGLVRVNIMDEKFIPVQLMRFQLAVYGMNKFSPPNATQLRVTMFQGAPLPWELALHGNQGSLYRPCDATIDESESTVSLVSRSVM